MKKVDDKVNDIFITLDEAEVMAKFMEDKLREEIDEYVGTFSSSPCIDTVKRDALEYVISNNTYLYEVVQKLRSLVNKE